MYEVKLELSTRVFFELHLCDLELRGRASLTQITTSYSDFYHTTNREITTSYADFYHTTNREMHKEYTAFHWSTKLPAALNFCSQGQTSRSKVKVKGHQNVITYSVHHDTYSHQVTSTSDQ